MTSKIALGTAQLGLNYGIANASGRVSDVHAGEMLDLARRAGIDTLDTAVIYGNAERLLGKLGVHDFRVISKVPALTDQVRSVQAWMRSEVEASLERLRLPRLHGLMLHHADDLAGSRGDETAQALLDLRRLGLVERVGVSIYRPAQLPAVIRRLVPDLVQAPMNVFDRRLADSGWLERLCAAGTEVHIRSVFLQGLLLMPSDEVPVRFKPWHPALTAWASWVAAQDITMTAACLAHVLSYKGISRVVVGCDSPEQLHEIVRDASAQPRVAPAEIAIDDERLINPATWSSP
jgi:aryl-alcohol dehydrogenase-like predicted oxidoreductase